MDVFVVGGEKKMLVSFFQRLEDHGIFPKWHQDWEVRDGSWSFPDDAEGVLILRNMTNHKPSNWAKEEARKRNLDVAAVESKFSKALPILEQMGWVTENENNEDLDDVEGDDGNGMSKEQEGTLMGIVLEAITLLSDEDPEILFDKELLCKKAPDFMEMDLSSEALADLVDEVLKQNEWLYRQKLLDVESAFQRYEEITDTYANALGQNGHDLTLGISAFRKAFSTSQIKGIKHSGRWLTTEKAVVEFVDYYLRTRLDHDDLVDLDFTPEGYRNLQKRLTEIETQQKVEDEIIISKQEVTGFVVAIMEDILRPINEKLTVLEDSLGVLGERQQKNKSNNDKTHSQINEARVEINDLRTQITNIQEEQQNLQNRCEKGFKKMADLWDKRKEEHATEVATLLEGSIESIQSNMNDVQEVMEEVIERQDECPPELAGFRHLLAMGAKITIERG